MIAIMTSPNSLQDLLLSLLRVIMFVVILLREQNMLTHIPSFTAVDSIFKPVTRELNVISNMLCDLTPIPLICLIVIDLTH